MPELSTQVLLDGLLVFIILLFVPFGVRRGVGREAIVSAGIFLGGALAAAWAEPGAAWLSQTFGVEPATGAFAVALAALLGGTFLLGYAAGGVVAAGRLGVAGRLSGALLAALNGALFLSFLLRFIDEDLQPGPGLDDGIVANALLRRFDLVLLAAGAAMLLCVLIGWLARAARRERVPPVVTPTPGRPAPVVGSVPAATPAPGPRAAPVLQETVPLPVEPTRAATWLPQAPANGHGAAAADPAWRDGSTVAGGGTGGAAWTNWGQTDEPGRRFVGTAAGEAGAAGRRCPTCGTLAGAHDVYCPNCGKSM